MNTARAYGLQAIDGPFAAIRDLDGMREVARRSRLLGMDGKWALHPDQIAIANEIYSPAQKQFDLRASRSSTPTAWRPTRRAAARSCSTAR